MGSNLQESRDLASVQALLNQIGQVSPWGSLTYKGPVDAKGRRDPTQTTATQTLNPQLQGLLKQLWGNQSALGQQTADRIGSLQGGPVLGQAPFRLDNFNAPAGQNPGFADPTRDRPGFDLPNFGPGAQTGINNQFRLENMLGGMNTADAFSGDRAKVEQATFDRAMSLLEPEWQQQDRRREQDLANRGLPMSGEAYQTDRSNTSRSRGETMDRLAMSSVLAGGAEQSRQLGNLLGTSAQGLGQSQQQRQNLMGEALNRYGANLQGDAQNFGQALSGFGANLQSNQQNFGQQLQAYGANTQSDIAQRGQRFNEGMANRQIPLQELMQLFGASQGNFAQPFVNTPQTGVQSFATSGGMSGAQGVLGGAIGGAGALSSLGPWGALAGGLGGGLMGLFS